jgi:Holliday junction resolvasome RuvABC DNA-binding subunit
VDKVKASKKVGKPTKKSDITKSKKLIKKGSEAMDKLGLAENEIENIFDILEKANPDL